MNVSKLAHSTDPRQASQAPDYRLPHVSRFRTWERGRDDSLLARHRDCFLLVGKWQKLLCDTHRYGLEAGDQTRDKIECDLAAAYRDEQRAALDLDDWEDTPTRGRWQMYRKEQGR